LIEYPFISFENCKKWVTALEIDIEAKALFSTNRERILEISDGASGKKGSELCRVTTKDFGLKAKAQRSSALGRCA
jgi:hypothetical protein